MTILSVKEVDREVIKKEEEEKRLVEEVSPEVLEEVLELDEEGYLGNVLCTKVKLFVYAVVRISTILFSTLPQVHQMYTFLTEKKWTNVTWCGVLHYKV